MKIIDKFLKLLKTDRNTFFTYILTLITIYLVIDRFVEILIMIFTGIGCSYWGPIKYALAFLCPIFAFLFSCSSKFVKSEETRLSFFYLYIIALYVLVVSMATQFVNAGCWLLLMSIPSYPSIATDFPNLIAPAFRAISLYLPLTTFYPIITWLIGTINDTENFRDSIFDYDGIKLSKKDSPYTGEYSCEIKICVDQRNGKAVKIAENKRYESMLVAGVSGSGKTSLIFEPMIARDIEKKYFYKKSAKEFAFAALKAGLASLNCPYDNDYINENFSLNMITADESKMSTYKSCMKKMIYNSSDDKIIYKDLGLTYISPDIESTSRIQKVAKNYHVNINLIDPNSPDTKGLNPFVYDNPLHTAIVISTILKELHFSNRGDLDINLGAMANFSTQAIENLSILLKVMYPKMHNEDLPTLEDMLDALTNYELVQNMCEEMEKDEELAKEYSILLSYFKRNFYPNSKSNIDTEKYLSVAATQLDNLLRYPGMRNILCQRTNNVNFDLALANGEFTLLCTRRGDLGPAAHTALGLFFLLSMQHAVLRRPGTEKTRIPHFLYVDEFADFVNKSTVPMFTLYRKYRVGTVISVQNLNQLSMTHEQLRQTIFANCVHKVVFGNNSPEDNDIWSLELGMKTKWDYKVNYDTEKGEYTKTLSGIDNVKKIKYKPGKVQSLKFKLCMYKVRDGSGKNNVGIGMLDFLEPKYKKEQDEVQLNFAKFSNSVANDTTINSRKRRIKKNLIPTFTDTDNSEEEIDPIRSNNINSLFRNADEGDAITNINKKNS
ncbi:MAG: TraM recognition domain-containing protein [Clostridia bacterium]|nr:TraM recognition domain-containing protein [Clostridia bacterium]